MKIDTLEFNDLSNDQLHELLKLRSEAFVTEQECVYNDPDETDKKSLHVLGYNDERDMVAIVRIYEDDGGSWHLGRVVVPQQYRRQGYSEQVVKAGMDEISNRGGTTIEISGQVYLEKFYAKLGYQTIGNMYLEDGIPHLRMIFSP